MSELNNAVDAVQEIATEVSPSPVEFNRVTSASDVKARLDWGEPAFTIVDVRDRQSFNETRIAGSLPGFSDEELTRIQQTLESDRDIYVYGSSDDDAKRAAATLSEAGFGRVSVISGGLSAWNAAGGMTEGRDAKVDKVSPDFVRDIVEQR